MLGGHLPELLIVLILALVVFGPKRLPEIGGALGKGIKEFRKGTSDLEGKGNDHDVPVPERPAQISSVPQDHDVTVHAPTPEVVPAAVPLPPSDVTPANPPDRGTA